MRVALLSDCYAPRLGGIEVQVHDLAAELVRAGHQVEVFTATPGAEGERYGVIDDVDGIPVHRMAVRMPWELPVNPWAPRLVRPRLVAGRFDVAHVHMGVVSPFATDMATLTLDVNLPTAITWHCVIDRSAPLFRWTGHARRWAERGAALSAVSAMAGRRLRSVVGSEPHIAVLPNGIDVDAWRRDEGSVEVGREEGPAEPEASVGTSTGRRRVSVVTAMRLAARKRPMALLRVMSEVRHRVPRDVEIELDIYGEGPLRGRMEQYVAQHGMTGWVRLPGRMTRADLMRRYHAADLYVASGRLEAFGIAALEARTAGLPVVGVADSGVEDFVEREVSGLLAGSDAEMADAITRLATDSELRERIARHNSSVPPTQAWDTVVKDVLAEYVRAGAHG